MRLEEATQILIENGYVLGYGKPSKELVKIALSDDKLNLFTEYLKDVGFKYVNLHFGWSGKADIDNLYQEEDYDSQKEITGFVKSKNGKIFLVNINGNDDQDEIENTPVLMRMVNRVGDYDSGTNFFPKSRRDFINLAFDKV